MGAIVIGTAGWAIPRDEAAAFAPEGSTLQRYAGRLAGVEINSSFHRPHRRATWERRRDAVPASFRFAAKMPKVISHERKLIDCAEPLARFLDEVGGLGEKLAVLLLQLPPKLAFDATVAGPFLELATRSTGARIACEPRHHSWFEPDASTLLAEVGIARVAADPAVVDAAARPGGWPGLAYHRLHGSPHIYRSSYDNGRLEPIADALRDGPAAESWCVFDNTASGAAMHDALRLETMLGQSASREVIV